MSRTTLDAVSYTILIVDVLPASLAMAITHLEERGYLVASAQDGEDAIDLAEDRERCFDAGASDYLSKPVEKEELIAVLRTWIKRRKPRGTTAGAVR